eukprot:5582496-Pleurochrysis_carterae.AAC.1
MPRCAVRSSRALGLVSATSTLQALCRPTAELACSCCHKVKIKLSPESGTILENSVSPTPLVLRSSNLQRSGAGLGILIWDNGGCKTEVTAACEGEARACKVRNSAPALRSVALDQGEHQLALACLRAAKARVCVKAQVRRVCAEHGVKPLDD